MFEMIKHVRDGFENMKKDKLSKMSREIWKGHREFLGMKNIFSKIKRQNLKIVYMTDPRICELKTYLKKFSLYATQRDNAVEKSEREVET